MPRLHPMPSDDALAAALHHPDAYLPPGAHDEDSDRRRLAARAAARAEVAPVVAAARRDGCPQPADALCPLTGSTFGLRR